METQPEITVYDHVNCGAELTGSLQTFAERAIAATLRIAAGSDEVSVLGQVMEVEVSLISDDTIAKVHMDFMEISGATDVITFHHGEIVVSVDTGRTTAEELGHSLGRELALYIAHGLLHLHGYDDHAPEDAEAMRSLQEQVLVECWIDQRES